LPPLPTPTSAACSAISRSTTATTANPRNSKSSVKAISTVKASRSFEAEEVSRPQPTAHPLLEVTPTLSPPHPSSFRQDNQVELPSPTQEKSVSCPKEVSPPPTPLPLFPQPLPATTTQSPPTLCSSPTNLSNLSSPQLLDPPTPPLPPSHHHHHPQLTPPQPGPLSILQAHLLQSSHQPTHLLQSSHRPTHLLRSSHRPTHLPAMLDMSTQSQQTPWSSQTTQKSRPPFQPFQSNPSTKPHLNPSSSPHLNPPTPLAPEPLSLCPPHPRRYTNPSSKKNQSTSPPPGCQPLPSPQPREPQLIPQPPEPLFTLPPQQHLPPTNLKLTAATFTLFLPTLLSFQKGLPNPRTQNSSHHPSSLADSSPPSKTPNQNELATTSNPTTCLTSGRPRSSTGSNPVPNNPDTPPRGRDSPSPIPASTNRSDPLEDNPPVATLEEPSQPSQHPDLNLLHSSLPLPHQDLPLFQLPLLHLLKVRGKLLLSFLPDSPLPLCPTDPIRSTRVDLTQEMETEMDLDLSLVLLAILELREVLLATLELREAAPPEPPRLDSATAPLKCQVQDSKTICHQEMHLDQVRDQGLAQDQALDLDQD
jgi:hypothetical protein